MVREADLVVAGAGIQGLMVALEAIRRGLVPVVVDPEPCPAARTTAAWGRILHGGLRYLQHADLARYRRSVRERSWFARAFPDLVRPLPCLMPLGRGVLPGRLAFAAAFAVDALLSADVRRRLPARLQLPRGRIVTPAEVGELAPAVDTTGLAGGALWHDATIGTEALVRRIASEVDASGGSLLTGWRVEGLERHRERVAAVFVRAHDGEVRTIRAGALINAAGPWSRELAARLDRDVPSLFEPSLAFNLILDLPAPAVTALAVRPALSGGQLLFLLPVEEGTLLGTRHLAWTGPVDRAVAPEHEIERLLAEARAALPGWPASRERVVGVGAGFLPARRPGDSRPRARDALVDHARLGGPRGLVSICGVKFTTARLLAERALDALRLDRARAGSTLRGPMSTDGVAEGEGEPDPDTRRLRAAVERVSDSPDR